MKKHDWKIAFISVIATLGVVFLVAFILHQFSFEIVYDYEVETSWDAVSGVAAWVGMFVSAFLSIAAIWYAIQVPKKIADRQDKIALFEKRLESYRYIEEQIHGRKWITNTVLEEDRYDSNTEYISPYNRELLSNDTVIKMLYPNLSERIDSLRKKHAEVHSLHCNISSALDCLCKSSKQDYDRLLDLFKEKYERPLSDSEELEFLKKSQSVYEDLDGEKTIYIPCDIYKLSVEEGKLSEELQKDAEDILEIMEKELQISL